MARIEKKILKRGLRSYTAEIRLMGFPHTNRSFRIRKEALSWARRTEPRRIQGFPLI
jgi:hypothetical protein